MRHGDDAHGDGRVGRGLGPATHQSFSGLQKWAALRCRAAPCCVPAPRLDTPAGMPTPCSHASFFGPRPWGATLRVRYDGVGAR